MWIDCLDLLVKERMLAWMLTNCGAAVSHVAVALARAMWMKERGNHTLITTAM